MKPATTALRELLMESVEVRATPKVIAEWEHNRYSKIKPVDPNAERKFYADVSPANDAIDLEWNGIYDINSITQPNRPDTGIAKARLSEPIKLQSSYRDKPTQTRYYAASDNDIFKYWSSSQRTKLTAVATNDYEFAQPITLTMMYEEPVISNKVVIGFETSYAKPKSYDVQISEDGISWATISSNVVPDGRTGRVDLWLKSDGSEGWGTSPSYTALTWIHGVRLVVRSMNEKYSNLDVIQIGARLENDLTDFVIDYDKNFEISDRSFIAPLGKASANQASITFTNLDLRFNNGNEESIYHNLIDKKVKFTLDLSVDARPAGSADERLREFTMYADRWGGQDEDAVTVQLKDSSVFLQEVEMPKVLWENMTVGAIVWQIMDTVGMTNYSYTRDVLDSGQVVPYFWSIEGTAWEQISELAEGTQTAVYFDEYDIMQIQTRKSLFGPDKTVSWNFDAVQNGQKLPDIIEMSEDDDLVVNQVDINWAAASFPENQGLPVMKTVWEPEEDTVVLRSARLSRDLLISSKTMFIAPSDAIHWPYESLINIRGEILRYRGKEYMSYKRGGGVKYDFLYSQEDKERIDADSDPNLAWANNFTGQLSIDRRGIGGSGTANHYLRPAGYSGTVTDHRNVFYPLNLSTRGGMNYNNGVVTLQPPFRVPDQEYFLVKHETQISGHPTQTIGTRFRFPEKNIRGDGWATAGLFVDGDWGDAGYYIEVSPSATIDNIEKRQWRHEISLVLFILGRTHVLWKATNGDAKGWKANILQGQWYDLDVRHQVLANGDAMITIFLDGVWAGEWLVPVGQRPAIRGAIEYNSASEFGHSGIFTRGHSKCDFEYLYAMNHYGDERSANDPGSWVEGPDSTSFLDLAKGSFSSGYIQREWKYGQYWSVNRGTKAEGGYWFGPLLKSRSNYLFDEFGPQVHEMREFNVQFDEDDVPVGHSYLYFSAQDQIVCTDYWADAFGAKFTLVNAIRRDAIVKGEDSVTFGSDNKVQQKFFVYGRVLEQEDDKLITKKDDHSIRRKGVVNLKFDNRWIQTEPAANDLGQWVVDLWGGGTEEVSLKVFGNPLVQLGDLVTINFPVRGAYPSTHKYYVVNIKNSYNQGLETDLVLRRASI